MGNEFKVQIFFVIMFSMVQQAAFSSFNPTLEIEELNGQNGFTINGVKIDDQSGYSINSAGDVNDDGFDDLIIGATGSDPYGNNNAGSSYVIFGSDNGFPHPFSLDNINGTNGFTINGVSPNDQLGRVASSAGDINGDEIDDLIITAVNTDVGDKSNVGSSYVIFGSDSGFPHPFSLTNIDGLNGFIINGIAEDDYSGLTACSAGDINDDGVDDLIIGAPYADPEGHSSAGVSYVLFGSDSGFPHPFNLANIDGLNGFTITGISSGDLSSASINSVGDINGDGVDDLIIGAFYANPNGQNNAGSSYVIFGSNNEFPHPFNLGNIDGLNGFTINGYMSNDRSGYSVNSAGDVNDDGIGDLIIGATGTDPNGNSNAGSIYVIFGSDSGFPHPFNLGNIDGINGFTINGIAANDQSGSSVHSTGDVNGDGVDDLIIGSFYANNNTGSSYVIFGSVSEFPHPFNLADINSKNGFTINGGTANDYFGTSGLAIDFNNDNINDLIIGAPGADPNGKNNAGSSYVVFGIDVDLIFKDGFE